MAIYRYPLQPPVLNADSPTETVDYVMIRRKRLLFKDGATNYYGLNLPTNKVNSKMNSEMVYIAMPQNIQTAYRPTYRQVDLGVVGMKAGELINAGNDSTAMARLVSEAARAALPEFTSSAFSGAANSASQMLGLAGNVDTNSLLQIARGKVFNPYTEQLFSNMQFRQHNFTFKMFARSKKESEEINKIILYLKEGALPIFGGENARFMEIPDKYDIKFVRMDPSGKLATPSEDLHFKIHTSVCTSIEVNYTPDGQYNAFKDTELGVGYTGKGTVAQSKPIQVPAVTVNCQFTETKFVTQNDILEGY